jgi:hypothetical protein
MNFAPFSSAIFASRWVNRCASPDSSDDVYVAPTMRERAVRERGLDRHRLVHRLHLPVEPVRGHDLRGRHGAIEFVLLRVVVQDPQLLLVVVDAGLGAQRLQRIAAVERKLHDLGDVLARVRRRAFEEEPQAPRPLRRVHAQAEEQRRVVAPQPLQDLGRRVGIGPRLRVADGDLARRWRTRSPCPAHRGGPPP